MRIELLTRYFGMRGSVRQKGAGVVLSGGGLGASSTDDLAEGFAARFTLREYWTEESRESTPGECAPGGSNTGRYAMGAFGANASEFEILSCIKLNPSKAHHRENSSWLSF